MANEGSENAFCSAVHAASLPLTGFWPVKEVLAARTTLLRICMDPHRVESSTSVLTQR